MATGGQKFISDLGFSEELIQTFKDCGITLYELVAFSFEDFERQLRSVAIPWKPEYLFNAIVSWRKRNKLFAVQTRAPETAAVTEGTQSTKNVNETADLDDPTEHRESSTAPQRTLEDVECKPELLPNLTTEQAKSPHVAQRSLAGVECELVLAPESTQATENGECSHVPQRSLPDIVCKPVLTPELASTPPVEQGESSHTQLPVAEVACKLVLPPTDPEVDHLSQIAVRSESTGFTASTLLSLLNTTEEGKDIIEKAKFGELSEAKQLQLAATVAKYHLQIKSRLLTDDLKTYVRAITTLFKFEKEGSYFICHGGDRKNNGGKIANKVANLKQKRTKTEKTEQEHVKRIKLTPQPREVTDPKVEEAIQWLHLNREPWDTVLSKWSPSFNHRKQYLKSASQVVRLLSTYSHYKVPHGYQLVDIDYDLLEVGAPGGAEKLKSFVPMIAAYIIKKGTDPSVVKLAEYLTDSSINADVKLCALLLGLNAVLPPLVIGRGFKPTIYMAQHDTIIFAESIDRVAPRIQETYASYAERKLPLVPKLVVLGTGIDSIQGRFFVCYSDVCYELPSLERATDVLIKLTVVFGLSFSKVSKLIWHFIASTAYGIERPESYKSITHLNAYLHTAKEQA